ncbi:MAG: hypothetical protein Q7T18_00670, partial [Sedimentisphaerales bacterium]|nr:hypothetical protein [Sedimentisphaerales bacterium]
MIYELLRLLQVHKMGFYAYQDIMFRAICAALTSLIIALIVGPKIIRWLMRKKIGDKPEFNHGDLNELNKAKANTPTMGGLIILLSIAVGTLCWAKINNTFIIKALFVLLWFGALGAWDDWLKLTRQLRNTGRDGLKSWEKLLFQFGGGVLVASFLYGDFANIPDGQMFWLPFYKYGIALPNWLFIIIAILYMTATSNAVNLTDGMDGLATGCIGIMSAALVPLCFFASETMGRTSHLTWSGYL